MLKFDLNCGPNLLSGGHDYYNFEFTLNEDAFTSVSVFLFIRFLKRMFLKIYSIIFLCVLAEDDYT